MRKKSRNRSVEGTIPEHLHFPKTLNQKKWMKYLQRPLSIDEKFLLYDYKAEIYLNNDMKKLHDICKNKQMHVPFLTNMHGNCLLESLNYHGIGEDVESLRKGLAMIMYLFRDYKDFFPHTESTLQELFLPFNEIEYVMLRNKEDEDPKIYKYSYNIMCQDLASDCGWSRLPTQLILMVISLLYGVRIIIINSDNFEIVIDVNNDNNLWEIYLGHLGESHYVPVDLIDNEDIGQLLYYDTAKLNLLTWAKKQEDIIIERHYDNADDNNNSDGFKQCEFVDIESKFDNNVKF